MSPLGFALLERVAITQTEHLVISLEQFKIGATQAFMAYGAARDYCNALGIWIVE